MYGLVTIIEHRDSQNPDLQKLELFDDLEEAINRARVLMNKYHEKYGKVYHEWASFGNLLGVAGNGDVTWRAYVKYIDPCKCKLSGEEHIGGVNEHHFGF